MHVFRGIWAFFIDTLQTFVIAAVVFFVVYVFLFRPFQVSGASMFPTFENNEYILTNIIGLKLDKPHRGDVVVFQSPQDTSRDFIKRIIALPGDKISVKEGIVYINGKKLDEHTYLENEIKTYGGTFLKEGTEVTVPQNSFFVMGDNRQYSSDSREWGFVEKDKIIGKSWIVYWPPGNNRIIENPTFK